MIQVAPSILAADFLHLQKDVDIVNSHADIFHLDIMDGTFVPNISFGFPVVEAIAHKAQKPLDVHLMIVHPCRATQNHSGPGRKSRYRHQSGLPGAGHFPAAAHRGLRAHYERIRRLRRAKVHSGKPGAHPRRAHGTGPIEVDGGIGPANAPEVVKAGAGILVAGSSVFKAQDPAAAILAMQQADKMAE